jgi:peroxiredoxin
MKVPDFELPDLGGTPVSLASLREKGPLWLFFMKSSCGTCQMSAPFAERAHQSLAGQDARVVLVLEDIPEAARAFIARAGLTLRVLIEADPWPVSEAYRLVAVPAFFLIEPDGSLSKYSAGFIRSHWEEAAADLMRRAGRPGYRLITDDDGVPELRPG